MSFDSHTASNFEDVEESSEVYADKPVPNFLQNGAQKFCILSIVGPTGLNQKHKQLCIRIYGCKKSKADANRWAALIRDDNPFDVYVMPTSIWGVLPPDVGIIDLPGESERLATIMDSFKKQLLASKSALKNRVELARNKQMVELEDVSKKTPEETIVGDENKSVPQKLQDPTQQFCVVNIVAPKSLDEMAIRIIGCKATKAEAVAWAAELRDNNNYFDVFTLETNQWGVLPPPIALIDDIYSSDAKVQEIYDQFKNETKAAKEDVEKKLDFAHKDRIES